MEDCFYICLPMIFIYSNAMCVRKEDTIDVYTREGCFRRVNSSSIPFALVIQMRKLIFSGAHLS